VAALRAIASYAIAYRFYARFIQKKVLETDDSRATPAERLNNGRDFEPMDRRVLFGHHFAAIAGAGPLVGPVLAAQMGFLPGTVWIIVGVILAGAVQDMTTLFFSMRRNGKTLGQMAREEIGPVGGVAALIAVLSIMVILLAVLALVVVLALAESPWGSFSIAMTLPIALLMGVYLRFIRPGRVLEVSIIGVGLLFLAIIGGGWIAESSPYADFWTFSPNQIVFALIAYGFIASVLPVWVLLAPRDYLSTFMKIGTIMLLAIGIMFTLPSIQMPKATEFAFNGQGPGLRRSALPVRLYHDSVRGALRVPRARGLGHDAEADPEREPDPVYRVRGHAYGVVRGDHGAHRRDHARPRRLLRDERPGHRARGHRPVGLAGGQRVRLLRLPGDAPDHG
jgi:carbon starvation protein